MKAKKILQGVVISSTLGITIGLGFIFITGESTSATANYELNKVSNGLSDSNEVLKNVKFKEKIKEPKSNMPFNVEQVYADIIELQNDDIIFSEVYFGPNGKSFVELKVTDADMNVADEAEVYELKDGIEVKYYTSERYEMLAWKDEGLSYEIIALRDEDNLKSKFGPKKLLKMIENMEKRQTKSNK